MPAEAYETMNKTFFTPAEAYEAIKKTFFTPAETYEAIKKTFFTPAEILLRPVLLFNAKILFFQFSAYFSRHKIRTFETKINKKMMIAQNLIHDYQMKWMRIQKVMQEKGADGCLISNGINLFYTTGHIYSGYFYLPAEGEPWYFVKRPARTDWQASTLFTSASQSNCRIYSVRTAFRCRNICYWKPTN